MKADRDLLLLIAVGLITLAGVSAEWIHFPLSAPVKGLDWLGTDTALLRRFPAAAFATTLVSALILLARGKERAGTWVLAIAAATLFAVPAYALFLDSTWLQKYVEDAIQHSSIRGFVQNFIEVPNTSTDIYSTDAGIFEYLPDRLRIAVAMLGWGWDLAAIGSVAIVSILLRRRWLSSWRTFARRLAMLCALLAATGVGAIAGDFRYRQADQRLALGNYAAALDSYAAALRNDSTLGISDVFLLKFSKAYYENEGAAHPYAQIYLASVEALTNPEGAKARLAAVAAAGPDSPVGAPFARMAQRKEAELWIRQALMHYKQGRMSNAALGFRHVLAGGYDGRQVRFYLARALFQLREFHESARLYQDLAVMTYNPSIKADVYNALGDAYAAAGDQIKAREAYGTAYSLDDKGNLWAVKGLSGT